MRVLGDNVETNANLLKRKVAVKVDNTIVFATPVDTGRARSNWQVDINSPAQGVVESLGDSAAQRSIAIAKSKIEEANPGDTIHITNNLSYIGALNDGWSAQAPANFVEEAVHDGVGAMRGVEILTGKGL